MPVTREVGWKCRLTGAVYSREQVDNYGNPPASPQWQIDNPGMGPGPRMDPVQVDVDRGPEREVPRESNQRGASRPVVNRVTEVTAP